MFKKLIVSFTVVVLAIALPLAAYADDLPKADELTADSAQREEQPSRPEPAPVRVEDVDWDSLKPGEDYFPDQAIITFRDDVEWDDVEKYLDEQGMRLDMQVSWPSEKFPNSLRSIEAVLPEGVTVKDAMEANGFSPLVKFVEPDFVVPACDEDIDDEVSPKSEQPWKRLYGSNALATMKATVQAGFSSNSKAVLTTLDSYYDALTASGLAGIYNCPILLTSGIALSTEARDEIARLGASNITIVGGTGSISDVVKNQVAAISGVTTVTRVAGSNAADTARKVYAKGGSSWGNTAIVVNLNTFHDALSSSPYSYKKHAPIFLTESGNTLSSATLSAIQAGGFTKVLIVGGTSSVPNTVVTQLTGIGVTSQRFSGSNAVATSVAFANYCCSNGMSANKMAAATDASYYDALVGGAFCGHNNAPLLLVSDSNVSLVTAFVTSHKSSIIRGYVLGGTSSVSASAFNSLADASY